MLSRTRGRRLAVVMVCATTLAAAAPAVTSAAGETPIAPPTAPSRCAHAGASPDAIAPAAYREAVRCLISAARRAAGLGGLRTERALRIAALRHTTDMVAERYFGHVGPHGDSVGSRVRATGYTGAPAWRLGEVLAWGTGPRATPDGVVAAWMASPPHHAVLLDPRMRDLGIGLATQVATTGAAGVTVTGVLGRRG